MNIKRAAITGREAVLALPLLTVFRQYSLDNLYVAPRQDMILVRDMQLCALMCCKRVVSKINRDIDKGTVSSYRMEIVEEVR